MRTILLAAALLAALFLPGCAALGRSWDAMAAREDAAAHRFVAPD